LFDSRNPDTGPGLCAQRSIAPGETLAIVPAKCTVCIDDGQTPPALLKVFEEVSSSWESNRKCLYIRTYDLIPRVDFAFLPRSKLKSLVRGHILLRLNIEASPMTRLQMVLSLLHHMPDPRRSVGAAAWLAASSRASAWGVVAVGALH